jgi:formate/nitrite transporter FocA (FNT family)
VVKLDRRTLVLWVVAGLVVGSIFASLSDVIRQNFLFVIYGGLVGGWIFFLTGIATVYFKETKQNPS